MNSCNAKSINSGTPNRTCRKISPLKGRPSKRPTALPARSCEDRGKNTRGRSKSWGGRGRTFSSAARGRSEWARRTTSCELWCRTWRTGTSIQSGSLRRWPSTSSSCVRQRATSNSWRHCWRTRSRRQSEGSRPNGSSTSKRLNLTSLSSPRWTTSAWERKRQWDGRRVNRPLCKWSEKWPLCSRTINARQMSCAKQKRRKSWSFNACTRCVSGKARPIFRSCYSKRWWRCRRTQQGTSSECGPSWQMKTICLGPPVSRRSASATRSCSSWKTSWSSSRACAKITIAATRPSLPGWRRTRPNYLPPSRSTASWMSTASN